MPIINVSRKEISCKLVYYGPGLSGKTTNLEVVHQRAPKSKVGELTSIATQGDRTLFFDYMPLELGTVGGLTTKFQLYTVPGQPCYDAKGLTRMYDHLTTVSRYMNQLGWGNYANDH